ERDGKLLPRHKDEGGAYSVAGRELSKSPATIESQVSKAEKLLETEEGRRDFVQWQRRNKGVGSKDFWLPVFLYPEEWLYHKERVEKQAKEWEGDPINHIYRDD